MITRLETLFRVVKAEVTSTASDSFKLIRETADRLFSFSAWTSFSTQYPPAPLAFEILFTWALDFIDLVLNSVTRLMPRIAASIILDEFIPDPRLRQRIMPLDQVAKFPLKVLLDQGIVGIQTGQPGELGLYNLIETWRKRIAFIKTPGLKTLSKLLFGTLFGRALRLFWLIVQFVQLMAVVTVMYRYVKIMGDVKGRELMFTAAFPQVGPRVMGRLVKRSNPRVTLDRRRYVRQRSAPLVPQQSPP